MNPFPTLDDRFEIRRQVGGGAFKSVYLAWDRTLEREVAILAVRTESVDEAEFGPLHEARTMARVGDHPNLVSVYDVIDAGEQLIIVSQFVRGGDLRSEITAAGGRLALHRAVAVASDVAAALAHAHAQGVVHRDVKPENILLGESGEALLADLGLAQILSARRTSPLGTSGSLPYAAPEIFYGAALGPGIDVYALGCVLYEMISGRPPFQSPSSPELVTQILSSPADPLRKCFVEVPPILEDLVLQCLEKEPAMRPPSCRDVAAALDTIGGRLATPDAAPADRDAARVPLAGRRDEVRAVAAMLDGLAAGRPAVVAVAGQSGAGKTRLLADIAAQAESRSFTVLSAGAARGGAPLGPLIAALRPLLPRIPMRGPAAVLRTLLGGGDAASAAPGLPEIRAGLAQLLAQIAAARPVVLLLDDIHAADSATVQVLGDLVRAAGDGDAPRVMLALSTAPVDAQSRAADVLELLRAAPWVTRFDLAPLDEGAILATLEARGVPRPSAQLVRHVAGVSGGRPRLVHETVSALLDGGAIAEQHGHSVALAERLQEIAAADPSSLWLGRVRRLEPSSRRVVDALATLEVPATTATLAGVLGEGAESVSAALDELRAAGLVTRDLDTHRIAHIDLQQAVYAAVAPAARERLHLRIGEHLQAAQAGDARISAALVAGHLVRAGSRGDPAAIVSQCSRAADAAMEVCAWVEATDLLSTAISVAARSPSTTDAELADLHRRAGVANFQLYDKGPAVHHLDAAVERFRSCGEQRGLLLALNDRARAAVQSGMVAYGEMQAITPLEQALAAAADVDDRLRATVLGTLAESYWIARQHDRSAQLADEALAIARDAEDDRLVADLCIHRALGHLQTMRLREAIDTYEEGIEAARAANHLTALEQCLTRQAMVSLLLGKLAAAESNAEEARRLNRLTRSGDESWSLSTMAAAAAIRGDHALVERYGEAGIDLLRRAKYPWSGAILLSVLAASRARRGEPQLAREAIALMLTPGFLLDDPAPLEAFVGQYLALIALAAGEAVAPLPTADLDAQIDLAGGFDFAILPALCAAVELWSQGAAAPPTEKTLPAIEFALDRGVLFSVGWPFFLPRVLAIAAMTDARWDDAVRHGQRAIDLARRARAAPEVELSRALLVEALQRRDGAGDRERAERIARGRTG